MMPYSSRLKYVSDWFVQLWAESLGKEINNNNETIHNGPTPVRALGATDQHSQVQLYREGPFDKVITIGPLIMMKFVVEATRDSGIPCDVSMNPIMIDGTGMCGGCRLTLNVDGKRITKFACVDGPDFNGYEVDFDEAISRSNMYSDFERHAYESTCNLFRKEENDG